MCGRHPHPDSLPASPKQTKLTHQCSSNLYHTAAKLGELLQEMVGLKISYSSLYIWWFAKMISWNLNLMCLTDVHLFLTRNYSYVRSNLLHTLQLKNHNGRHHNGWPGSSEDCLLRPIISASQKRFMQTDCARDSKSEIQNPKFKIWNSKSEIQNLSSAAT